MKPISNDFKTELLKFGREYENIIGIFDYDVLATEDNDFLVTEDDKDIISGVSKTDYEKELDDVDIYSIKLITKGEILSTLMKELDFETTEDIEIGRIIDYRIGLKTRSGKNLFDKDNASLIEGTVNTGTSTITSATANRTTYIPCKPNTTYTISKRNDGNTNRFAVATSVNEPAIGVSTYQGTRTDDASSITITTNETANYLVLFFYRTAETLITLEEMLGSIQIEEGSTATPYEKYGMYDYINYGKFIVYKKEYDETTERYTYTCYDYMLRSMRVIGSEFRISTPTINGVDIIKKICEVLTFDFDDTEEDENHKPTVFGMIGHKEQEIDVNTFMQYKLTYRDLLGLLCQYFGVSMYMENNELKLKLLGNIEYNEDEQEWFVNNDEPLIVATLDENYLKDSNVSFKNKYGKINALEITGIDESKQQYIQDEESVTANGLTLFTIQKNILFNDTTVWEEHGYDMTQDIFKMLNGIDYELNDISTSGVLFLEWLDFYNIEVKGTTYKCLLLNSEITINAGIQESIYTEMPTETVEEYTSNPNTRDDIIADSVRARGNVYATNVEASGRVDANLINANEVGEELAEVIRQISPGGGVEIPIQDTAPENPEEDDLWIDTSEPEEMQEAIKNEYSDSTTDTYSCDYLNGKMDIDYFIIETVNFGDNTFTANSQKNFTIPNKTGYTGYVLKPIATKGYNDVYAVYIPANASTVFGIKNIGSTSYTWGIQCVALYVKNNN